MKPKNIAETISNLDEDIVDSAEKKRAEKAVLDPKKGVFMQRKLWIPIAATAACAVLAVGVWGYGYKDTQNKILPDNDPLASTRSAPTTEPAPSTEPKLPAEPEVTQNPIEITNPIETIAPQSTQSEEDEQDEPVIPAEFEKINAVKLANYPKAAPYPDEELMYPNGKWDEEAYNRIYKPWEEEVSARNGAAKKIPDISDFYNATAKQFLTNSDGENRVYSPLSIYVCLAMLAETADGNSRDQILELLECENIEALRENIYNIWNGNYRNDGATVSILANSIWLNESIAYKQPTLDALAEKYYASSFSGNMAKEDMTLALRAWLNLQTGGLLEDSVEQLKLDPETVIALCNTVYFRAKWSGHFLEEKNDIKTFHSPAGDIETEFMNSRSESGPYYWGEDYGAIARSFADGGYMWLILPDEDKTVDDVLNSGEYLDMVKDSWKWEKKKWLIVNYSVPKFDVTCDTDLTEGLKELGITDVFDKDKSGFGSLCDTDCVYVGQAKHSARVVIDEEGCTATAFTAMVCAATEAPPDEEMDFVLDRPFIFVIDNGSNQPLFTGVVNMPQQ